MESEGILFWILVILYLPIVVLMDAIPLIIVAGILELGRRIQKEGK